MDASVRDAICGGASGPELDVLCAAAYGMTFSEALPLLAADDLAEGVSEGRYRLLSVDFSCAAGDVRAVFKFALARPGIWPCFALSRVVFDVRSFSFVWQPPSFEYELPAAFCGGAVADALEPLWPDAAAALRPAARYNQTR